MSRYMLSLSPRYSKIQARQASRCERRTMVLAIMVALLDVVVRVGTVVATLVLLLLALLITANGLVALSSNWRVLLGLS